MTHPGGAHRAMDAPTNATADPLKVGGNAVYSAYFEGGMGYRIDNTTGIAVDDEAYATLGEIGVRSTLRYAVQLLTPANVVVKTNGRDEIGKDDIEELDSLFYDAKSSAKLLAEQKAGYLQ